MISRRTVTFLLAGISASFLIGIPPAAQARGNGGNGNGGGNGGGNGNGGGAGNGNGGGNGSGNGGGNNGNGNGNGNGNANGQGGTSSGAAAGQTQAPAAVNLGRTSIEVHHSDGMTESIRDNRYEMRDARGRLIINRRAGEADRQRLRRFGS